MSLEAHEIELIDGFLRGELNAESLDTFKTQMESNPNFKLEYEHRASLQKLMANNSNRDLKQILQKQEKTWIRKAKPTKSPAIKYLRLAASLLIIAGILSFYYKPASDSGLSKLYTDNFTDYPNDYIEVVRGGSEESTLKEIFTDYNNREYNKVIAGIDSHFATTKIKDDKLLFFKMLALMSLEKHKDARQQLNTLKTSDNMEGYQNQIAWYSALNYLALDDAESAKSELNKLLTYADNFRKPSAKDLLEVLNKYVATGESSMATTI